MVRYITSQRRVKCIAIHTSACNEFNKRFISKLHHFLMWTDHVRQWNNKCEIWVFIQWGAVCKATWNGYPSYSLLTFISRFVIDFLSIRKVIIFSAIATDDRHPLRSRSIHQNAANCMTIRFRYIAQSRGVRKTYCARSRNDVRRLTSRSNGMPSKKIMESLRTFVAVETVLRRCRMFQGSDEV